MMIEDFAYCASSFLQYRCIADKTKTFKQGIVPNLFRGTERRYKINDSIDLENALREQCEALPVGGKTALALSGGIDSAILARFMPKGTVAYTFKCIVPGVEVVDETKLAAEYAKACGLEHRIVEVYWEDLVDFSSGLMKHKGAPIHSIEVQIYKAACQAKDDGFEHFVFGESADANYGGQSGLMSKDWLIGEFVDRYSYVLPYKVLKSPKLVLEPFAEYTKADGYVDVFEFMRNFYFHESMGSYYNACGCANIDFEAPFAGTWLAVPLDYDRIRSGDGKYLVREVFRRLYPDFEVPPKTPMPRPMNEWMSNWAGPTRPEFWPNCTKGMTGDQKWLVWALEKFMNEVMKI